MSDERNIPRDIILVPAKLGASALAVESRIEDLVPPTRGAKNVEPVPCRVYHDGREFNPEYREFEIVVPEPYATDLDEVRALGTRLETNPLDVDAHSTLARHDLGRRALPDDVLIVKAALPAQLGSPQRIVLFGEPAPYASRSCCSTNGGFRYGREVVLYQRDFNHYLWRDMAHLWVHGFSRFSLWNLPFHLYEMACALEREPGKNRDRQDVDEDWAIEIGHRLMGRSGAEALKRGRAAPVRTAIAARALASALDWSSSVGRGSHHDQLEARARVVEQEIVPLARATMIERAGAGGTEPDAHDAAVLLLFIGSGEDVSGLTGLERLSLHGLSIDVDWLERLRQLPALKHLDLSYTRVSSIRFSRGLPLETLSLAGARVGASELLYLRQSPSLRSLDLRDSLVGEVAIEILAAMPLTYLNVSDAGISLAGQRLLKDLMPRTEVVGNETDA